MLFFIVNIEPFAGIWYQREFQCKHQLIISFDSPANRHFNIEMLLARHISIEIQARKKYSNMLSLLSTIKWHAMNGSLFNRISMVSISFPRTFDECNQIISILLNTHLRLATFNATRKKKSYKFSIFLHPHLVFYWYFEIRLQFINQCCNDSKPKWID